jgi:hypothetical protein
MAISSRFVAISEDIPCGTVSFGNIIGENLHIWKEYAQTGLAPFEIGTKLGET